MYLEEFAIGIDFGTTSSCMAVLRDDKIEVIPNEFGENITPSLVSFLDDKILVGEQTLEQLIKNPKKTIYSIKRLIGKSYKEIIEENNSWTFDIIQDKQGINPIIKIDKNKYFSPDEILQLIISKLIKSAEVYLGQPITKAVITVPAYFNNAQRSSIKNAAKSVGLTILNIINEPTAASLAYGLNKKFKQERLNSFSIFLDDNITEDNTIANISKDKFIIVFDLGGGTFDVTLLKIVEGELFDIKATSGNSHLGGDDFDKKIMNHCLKRFCEKYNLDEEKIKLDSKAMNRLKFAAENAKKSLSTMKETEILIDDFWDEKMLDIKLNVKQFEILCTDLLSQLIEPLERVLKDSRLSSKDINEIILVGASTKMPKIKEVVKSYFKESKINDKLDPNETVAIGAAIQAAKLTNHDEDNILNDIVLMDITPFSLGTNVRNFSKDPEIRKKGSVMHVIIPRGYKIPCNKVEMYETSCDNQKGITLSIYEGEKKYVKDNHLLGRFDLDGFPSRPKGQIKFECTFSIDADGILEVKFVETSSKISNSIKITNDIGYNNNKSILENKIKDIIIEEKYRNEIIFKKSLKDFYSQYLSSKNTNEKFFNICNFNEVLFDYIKNFGKDENDTLGQKYFLYSKILFKSYKDTLQFEENVKQNAYEKKIIDHSQKLLDDLSNFKNISCNNYIELLKYFEIEPRNNKILNELVVYTMELLYKKAEKFLSNNSNKLKYENYRNAKYIYNNCIRISELFYNSNKNGILINLELINENNDLINRYNTCLSNCKKEESKLKANLSIELDKGKLFDDKNLSRDKLLILLDTLHEQRKKLMGLNDFENESILLANIVKIKYKFLKNKNFCLLKKYAEKSILYAERSDKDIDKKSPEWYKEIKSILKEITNNNINKLPEKTQDNLEEIREQRKKSDIEFIKFILNKYPLKKNPLEHGQTVEQQLKDNKNNFLLKLSGRYNPSGFKRELENDKNKYEIYSEICREINNLYNNIDESMIELEE